MPSGKNTCWRCDTSLDPETPPIAPLPPRQRGDMTVCGRCGAVGVFTAAGYLRAPTSEERPAIMAAPNVFVMVDGVLVAQGVHGV